MLRLDEMYLISLLQIPASFRNFLSYSKPVLTSSQTRRSSEQVFHFFRRISLAIYTVRACVKTFLIHSLVHCFQRIIDVL